MSSHALRWSWRIDILTLFLYRWIDQLKFSHTLDVLVCGLLLAQHTTLTELDLNLLLQISIILKYRIFCHRQQPLLPINHFKSLLSKPAKQVWYWALRVYWERFRVCMCVCTYVCMWSNSSQTTEPICIKIIPANRAFYADCYRLLRFEIFTKYDEYFVVERTPFLNNRSFATAP